MSDTPDNASPEDPPGAPAPPAETDLPPFVIEGARSSRSKCKACRRKIDKGALRIGILIDGPYGVGYLWHHLNCAARRRFDDVEEAYRLEAWNEAKEPPASVPSLDKLQELREKSEVKKQARKEIPYAEPDPSGRAKCKHCGEVIPKDTLRVVLGRDVEFGNQIRTAPVNVHPRCVAAEIRSPECNTEADGFAGELRSHSEGLDEARMIALLAEIGDLS